MKFEKDITKK